MHTRSYHGFLFPRMLLGKRLHCTGRVHPVDTRRYDTTS